MRTTKILAATIVAAAALTACNKNDNANQPAPVRFTAGIDAVATPETRAAGTVWGNDAIGVFMMQEDTALEANKKYTTPGTGAFTAASDGDAIYYPMDGSAVEFIAYYPFATGAALGTPIDITIGAQTNQSAFDLLWVSADNSGDGYSKTSGNVTLGFTHKLAKIVMNVTADDNVGADAEDLAAMTVAITGMNTKNTFNLETGALGTAGTAASITPRALTAGSAYDAIIMPGDYDASAVKVVFTVGEEDFVWTLSDGHNNFAAGNEYTYAVKLSRTGLTATGSIAPWSTIDRGNVSAD